MLSRRLLRYAFLLIPINILLTGAAFLFRSFFGGDLLLRDILILSSLFSVNSVITIGIFLRGQTREPESQTLHTLTAVSIKFLLDMIVALLWFFISKKTHIQDVIAFFIIYLTLTLFTFSVVLKLLKNKSL